MSAEKSELLLQALPQAVNPIEAEYGPLNSYVSPFEVFLQRFPETEFDDISSPMQYTGTLAKVFAELETALQSPQAGSHFSHIALHPARLIRALIDWKIDHPSAKVEKYITKTVEVGLAIFQQSSEALTTLRNLREVVASEQPDLFSSSVEQKDDFSTWRGTNPHLSYATALQLALELKGQDILFLALGHGGTAAGLDVYSGYVSRTQNTNSAFYVIRFSRNKKHDEQPQLTEEEIMTLRTLAQGRKIVVFQEDSATHMTARLAQRYFGLTLGKDIRTRSNFKLGYGDPIDNTIPSPLGSILPLILNSLGRIVNKF